jgi:hypothetical protein
MVRVVGQWLTKWESFLTEMLLKVLFTYKDKDTVLLITLILAPIILPTTKLAVDKYLLNRAGNQMLSLPGSLPCLLSRADCFILWAPLHHAFCSYSPVWMNGVNLSTVAIAFSVIPWKKGLSYIILTFPKPHKCST